MHVFSLLNMHACRNFRIDSSVIDYTDEDKDTKTACNKDTGTRHKLQKWTQDLFVVHGGGHIETWQPLYQ